VTKYVILSDIYMNAKFSDYGRSRGDHGMGCSDCISAVLMVWVIQVNLGFQHPLKKERKKNKDIQWHLHVKCALFPP